MDDDRMKQQLNIRRTTLLASLSRAEQFLQAFEAGRDALQVPLRLENLEIVWQGLEETQRELEEMETSNQGMVRNLNYRSDFESKFFAIKAGLLSKLPPPINQPSNLPLNPPTHTNSGLHGLKLPTIALPEFSGDYQDWLGFHDTFLALIHSNPEVADIQKFHYLRAAVKGEAAQVIESIAISAANYQLAWEALVSRYSNEYLLKKRHLQALFETPRMKQESAATLHGLVDEFERHTKILRQLGEPTDTWSTMLEHLLCTRLHDETLKLWEDHASTIDKPTYTNLVDFLQRRIRVLESIAVNHESVPLPPNSHSISPFSSGYGSSGSQKCSKVFQQKMSTHAVTENNTKKGNSGSRPSFAMRQFKKLSLQEKLNIINTKRLCFNCLQDGHYVGNCPCQTNCRMCQKRHHTWIHPGYADSSPSSNVVQCSTSEPQFSTQANVTVANIDSSTMDSSTSAYVNEVQAVSSQISRNSNVFMLTVVLVIVDVHGQEHLARALLDSASQPNLMTDRMAQMLMLKRKKVNVQLQGPGGISIRASDSVPTQIRSRKEDFTRDIEFLVLPRVTSAMPEQDVPIVDWKTPKDLFLADPNFNKRADIDMIIGIQHFFSCFTTTARIQLAKDLPELVDSVFGWIVAGSGHLIPTSPDSATCNFTAVCLVTLEESLERFWKLEELPHSSDYSEKERKCEEWYKSTVSRDSSGRYQVRLPRHPEFNTMIGESKAAAIRRFRATEARLEREPDLKKEYHKFMEEYLSLGHMRLVPEDKIDDKNSYYLPHHPIVKESSTTTKVRVVFDGSAKTSTGFSLNDALLVGPVVQDELLAIILRFMTFSVAIVADVEKMYRQILLHLLDCPFQYILWRFSKSQPIQVYQLLTVTYGLAPSSFLATRTLLQLAEDEGPAYPLALPVLRKGFYVNDCVAGAQTIEEAIKLRKELDDLLRKGGFILRKWASNKLEVLRGLSQDQIGTQSIVSFTPQESLKTLGIVWEPEADKLRFDSKVTHPDKPATKTSMLSSISQLFDPLGLAAPIVVRGKMLMQELWLLNCSCYQPVPDVLQFKWGEYFSSLEKLTEFRVDRYALLPHAKVQLHTFTDALEAAYGACIYARSVDSSGNVRVRLIASKTRVAPLKRITLPRLELCGALVGAQLYAYVSKALQIEISDSFFWCDSTVTLHWLRSPPNNWKTFIANRVSEIQTLTHGFQWNHVAGSENPADLLSRGMDVDDFVVSSFWMHGPEWLFKAKEYWINSALPPAPEHEMEHRKVVATITRTAQQINEVFDRYSAFYRLRRITAYCLRFIENIRHKARTQPLVSTGHLPSPTLTIAQISSAEDLLVRLAKADAFRAELKDVQKGKMISKHSPICVLNPFLDPQGTLRVGGRLRLSDQPFRTKHPALLPNSHPFTRMLIRTHHVNLLHGGGQLTLARIHEKYWPLHGRRTVRSVLRQCIRCARVDPVQTQQQIGQLPVPRITPSRPFTVTGIDYAGPVYLRAPHKRAPSPKAYICVFICFSTKAVHLELVSDLTTAAFMATLRRFIARRGFPAHIHSDNGKNFEGAKNELNTCSLQVPT
ncbi:uncharacterized protein LOC135709030 [Ochlerotatus camptorhynchus]|uniref:uncharacterized protein LOC135709030 n=1 Tax=Ochlerotatus camptorhynchus TaxID=644619 RepID=UPI0031DF834C